MPHDIQPDLQDKAAVPRSAGDAKIYTMRRARRPVPDARAGNQDVGQILQFPIRTRGRFDAEVRAYLIRLAAKVPGLQPLLFGHDGRGAECCHLGNGVMISWTQPDRMILTDTFSGYVDYGPFDSLDEVCLLIVGLDS